MPSLSRADATDPSGSPTELRKRRFWTALKTKQASSSDAVVNVRRQGFEYFHPQYRRRSVRGVRAVAPLFPYYLMVRVDDRKQDWRVLANTKGVTCVLMSGDRPGLVHDDRVAELRHLTDDTDDGYYHDPDCEHHRFTPGESVEGLRGLFEGKFGIYRGLAGGSAARVRVLFSILGRDAEFEVYADDMRAVANVAAA